MTKPRVVVLVSPDYSATYFANMLMKHVNVVGVFVEKQHQSPPLPEKIGKALRLASQPWQTIKTIYDRKIFDHYNSKLSGDVDRKEFGNEGIALIPGEGCEVIHTEGRRQMNNPIYVEQMRRLHPDIIAICGTSIVKEPIIKLPPKGIMNLHTGLPQKYRGSWTTQWAIHNEEPEYVGATVHFVDAGVDTGRIIYQGRPEVAADDNPESLNVKTVKLGVEMMIQAIKDIAAETITSHEQKQIGKLYLEKMFTAEVIRKAWDNSKNGVIAEYLANKTQRDQKVIEIMLGTYSGSI